LSDCVRRRVVTSPGSDGVLDGAERCDGCPNALDGLKEGSRRGIVAAGGAEEGCPYGAVSAAADLAGEMLPEAVGGGWRDCDDRRAGTVGQRELDEPAPRLLGIEPAAVLAQCAANNFLDMGEGGLADVFSLCWGVPVGPLRFVAADRTIRDLVSNLCLPIFEKNLEIGLAGFRRATTVELTVVIEVHLDGDLDTTLDPFHLSKQSIEHRRHSSEGRTLG